MLLKKIKHFWFPKLSGFACCMSSNQWSRRLLFSFQFLEVRRGDFLCIKKYNMYKKFRLDLKENEDVTHLNISIHKVPVVAQIGTA